jgi:hypothetical protein
VKMGCLLVKGLVNFSGYRPLGHALILGVRHEMPKAGGCHGYA